MIMLKWDGTPYAIGDTLHSAILSAQCRHAATLGVPIDYVEVWTNHQEVTLVWLDSDGKRHAILLRVKEGDYAN